MAMTWDQRKIDQRARAAAQRACVATAAHVVEHGTQLISSPPKTGRVYKLTQPRRVHQASAPGEAPATDLGGLIASGSVVIPAQQDFFQVVVKANWSAVYARALELGDENVEARPFARPALDFSTPGLKDGLRLELNKEFGR